MANNKPASDVKCFFDIAIDDQEVGRIVFKLFHDVCPKTCENFRQLCTGEAGNAKRADIPLHYKGTIFHRVVKSFIIQGGDIESGDGRGGESIYDGCFDDENFQLFHDEPYLLSMANRGPNTNKSQFFITTNEAPHLDRKHVVFGRVVSGLDTVLFIERQQVDLKSRPLKRIEILNCGEYKAEDTQRVNLLSNVNTLNANDEQRQRLKQSEVQKTTKHSKVSSHTSSSKHLHRRTRSHDNRLSESDRSRSRSVSSSSSRSSRSTSSTTSSLNRSRRSRGLRSEKKHSNLSPSNDREPSRTSKDHRSNRHLESEINRNAKAKGGGSKNSTSFSDSLKEDRKIKSRELIDTSIVKIQDDLDDEFDDEYDYAPNPHYKCSVKKGEIPEVPVNRFLLREPTVKTSPRLTKRSEISMVSISLSKAKSLDQSTDKLNVESESNNNETSQPEKGPPKVLVSKSGRIMKGRGTFKFRTPSPTSESQGKSRVSNSKYNHPDNYYDDFSHHKSSRSRHSNRSKHASRSRSRSPSDSRSHHHRSS